MTLDAYGVAYGGDRHNSINLAINRNANRLARQKNISSY